VSALGLALAACAGRGDESVTVDGQVITKRQFEAMISTTENVLRYVADENWDAIYDFLDEESKKSCPKQEYIIKVSAAFALLKLFVGAEQWEELTAGLKELAKEIKAISWTDFKLNPHGVFAGLDARVVGLVRFGNIQPDNDFSEFITGFTFEDGKARLHAPDVCGGFSLGEE